MKNITKIFYIIAFCASIFSCSSTKKNTNIDDLTLITTAHNEGDIPFLINALETYPFYRGYTESYLYNYDYSKTKYPQLKRYAQVAQNDITATIFFDSLLIQKQTFIIDSLFRYSSPAVSASSLARTAAQIAPRALRCAEEGCVAPPRMRRGS